MNAAAFARTAPAMQPASQSEDDVNEDMHLRVSLVEQKLEEHGGKLDAQGVKIEEHDRALRGTFETPGIGEQLRSHSAAFATFEKQVLQGFTDMHTTLKGVKTPWWVNTAVAAMCIAATWALSSFALHFKP